LFLLKKEILIQFGKRLRNLRTERNYTQQQLADELNIEVSQVSRIERGIINTSVTTVYSISKILQINPGELFNL
jgi:transcriptional regulator with XRE-family HTH domain